MPKNKFVKLVHLVGFITKKLITMHGHMNVKFTLYVRRRISYGIRSTICPLCTDCDW